MDEEFLELISLTDRVHRHCLHLIKAELERISGSRINPTQALIVLKIGHLAMSSSELTTGGWYPGTNLSYSIKKLVSAGLVTRQRRPGDRRSSALRLTEKGHHLRRLLLSLYRREAEHDTASGVRHDDMAAACESLRRLDRSLASIPGVGEAPRRHRSRTSTRSGTR